MRVAIGTVLVDDETRRAIRRYYGEKGLATRSEVRELFIALAESDLQCMKSDDEDDPSSEAQP